MVCMCLRPGNSRVACEGLVPRLQHNMGYWHRPSCLCAAGLYTMYIKRGCVHDDLMEMGCQWMDGSFLQAGQGPILRSTKRIQLTLDSSRLLGATWVMSARIFRLEVHIGISITSIKTASDRPENGVFIAELIPNSVAHNAGLKVTNIVNSAINTSCFVAHSLMFRNAVHCTVDWRWNCWCEWAKPYWKDTQWGRETVTRNASHRKS